MKTSELTEAALDWAAHMVLNPDEHIKPGCSAPPYSSDWLWCGPLIEREKIALLPREEGDWSATCEEGVWVGPTPLVAAMRCFVASRMGDTIEVPEGL
jgi:hypothetical protein